MLPNTRNRWFAGARRGAALVLVLLLTVALAALALSAIYLSASTGTLTWYNDREREFKYAAQAALVMGKSRLLNDPLVLPDSGYVQLLSSATINGADAQPLPGVRINLYAGRTGSTSGQFGRYVSVVAEAFDPSGSRHVRRAEYAEENFARFARWTDDNPTGLVWVNGMAAWGPVHYNSGLIMHTGSPGAEFHDDVSTATTISNAWAGNFFKGYKENVRPMALPGTAVLTKLPGYATPASMVFNAPNSGGPTEVLMRVEFVTRDINGNAVIDDNEGFFRVYQANPGQEAWLRGDLTPENCGDWHEVMPGPTWKIFPAAAHAAPWFPGLLAAAGHPDPAGEAAKSFDQIMADPWAMCFPGGDPYLVNIEDPGYVGGGDETTFRPVGTRGQWIPWGGAVHPAVAAATGAEAPYLVPVHRFYNPSTKGVAHFNGTVGVSGTLRGHLTLHATGHLLILEDTRYADDPASAKCKDLLGLISGLDIWLADNAINRPRDIPGIGWKFLDGGDTDLTLHAVTMALNSSLRTENHNTGPTAATVCEGVAWGGGCFFMFGGEIDRSIRAKGVTNGQGYLARYVYDRCVLRTPPPYFPTTGRLLDNRVYEIDPVRFNVAALFASLKPLAY